MKPLIELLRSIRSATALHVHLRFLDEFLYLVGPTLKMYIRWKVSPNDVEDILQEALTDIALGIDNCHASTESAVWGWCYTITHRKIAQHYRIQERRIPLANIEEIVLAVKWSGEVAPIYPDERLKLDAALKMLGDADEPCVLYLLERFIFQQTFEEMGDSHGKSPDAMRQRVNRCLELAGELVGKEES